MRIKPAGQTGRRVLTATVLAALVTGGAFLSAGAASATTLLATSCQGSVSGAMGSPVAVDGRSLSEIVRTAAQPKETALGLNGVDADQLAKDIAGKGALDVGEVPRAAGGSIGGDAVAAAVGQALQGDSALGESTFGTASGTMTAVKQAVTRSCGLTTLATDFASSSSDPAGQARGDLPGSPRLGGLPGGTGNAFEPPRNYTGIPGAVPGLAVPPGDRYPQGTAVPGRPAPQTGVLPGDQGQTADVRNAGNAEALGADGSPGGYVQLPMLIAVVVLAGVSAGLVRAWVLRRAS